MKRLLCAAVALSLVGGSAAMAQPYDRHDNRHDNRYDHHDNRNNGHHRWARGERLPAQYRSHGYYVDYHRHHLRAPPRGYQWVHVDNQYMLVALTSGLIASIIASN
jgi:Ni/Co efflux regulator RcnB